MKKRKEQEERKARAMAEVKQISFLKTLAFLISVDVFDSDMR